MKHFVLLSYLAWFPLVFVVFQQLPRYRALIVTMVAGTLFLPELKFTGTYLGDPPDVVKLGPLVALQKGFVLALAPLLAVICLDSGRLFAFRPKWYDIPMLGWCVSSLISNYLIGEPLNNLYGQTRDHLLTWGIPYFLGRLYIDDFAKVREAVEAVIVWTLVYVPFCLVEIVRGPYWHEKLFAYFQHDPGQAERMGGYRPIVFMQHGLELSMWVMLAAMAAFWLWRTRTLKTLTWKRGQAPIAMEWVATGLVMLAVMSKSLGAIGLGIVGLATLYQSRWLKLPVLLMGLIALPVVYMSVRTDGTWTGKDLVMKVAGHDPRAAQSAEFRFDNEVRLIARAKVRLWYGWGDTGEALNIPKKDPWDPKPVPDGYWILTLGSRGLVGLISLYVTMLLPTVRFMWHYKMKRWPEPLLAPAAVLIVFLPLYMIDCLFNAMINPVYIMLAGALQSVIGTAAPAAPVVVQQAARQRLPARATLAPAALATEPAPDAVEEPVEAPETAVEPEEPVTPPAAPPPGVLARKLPWAK